MQDKYDKMKNTLLSTGCQILTPIENFNNSDKLLHSKSKLTILSKCGHESIIQYDNFKSKGCGIYCKKCINKNRSEKLTGTLQSTLDYDSFIILKNIISTNFEIIKMCEGTLADAVIRPLSNNTDKWLPIQLKATNKPQKTNSNNYYFSKINKYETMLVFCVCIEDKRMWLFEGNFLKHLTCLRIGNNRSMYSSYEVTSEELNNRLTKMYSTYNLIEYENANIPISKQCINEQKYRKFRESKLPYINFEYPEREGLCYDFIVNNLKIQENVASKDKDNNTYYIQFSRNGKRKTPYIKGNNHLYWFSIPDTTNFYLISEELLFQNNHIVINTTSICDKRISLYPNHTYDKLINKKIKSYWMNQYLFDYNTITKDDIINIFESGIVPIQSYKTT